MLLKEKDPDKIGVFSVGAHGLEPRTLPIENRDALNNVTLPFISDKFFNKFSAFPFFYIPLSFVSLTLG